MPETSNSAVVINKLNVNNLTKKIENLIKNKNLLINLQKKNYKNFYFTPNYITRKIELIRRSLLPIRNFNIINKNTKIKVLHITNFNESIMEDFIIILVEE